MKFKLILMVFFTVSALANSEIDKTLDSFHEAAGRADQQGYFDLLADDAVFLGTDGSERWTKTEFERFVAPYFSQGKGWLYQPTQRHINEVNHGTMAFFDELLENNNYGQCRGSGVLILTEHGWKILQYNLSIPIPNAIAGDVVKSIKVHQQTLNKMTNKDL